AELSTQLFYTLVKLLQGRALDIAQNTDLGNGLEVYRKLVSEYRPRLASRFVGTLTQLMSHKFTASLEAEIPFFEKLVRRYEAETGKVLDDTIKLGIIINGLQDDSLKQHVVRNSARLKTYQLLKDELLEVARTSRVLSEQPVPMDLSALPKWKQKVPKEVAKVKERGYVAAVTLPQEAQGFRDVLVDTGAGSLKTLDGQGFSVEYAESDKVNFSVLSSGLAASKGTWTVIGPDVQCLILDKNAHKVRRALGYTKTIELQKKRGVYWLPVQSDEGKGPEPTILAATKAAKKVVPAEAMRLEEDAGGTAQGQAADGTALGEPPKEDSEGPTEASSSRGPEIREAADRPALGEPPEEDSEAQRKTRSKRIPDLVSEQEYKDHMMTHLPFRSWCDHCIAGKSREDSHPLREARKCKGEVPRFCVDYCFLGRALKGEMPKTAEALKEPLDAEDGQRPILVMVDQETGATFSYLVTKGVNNYAVHVMSEALKFAGRQRVLIMSDGEPAIRALIDTVARQAGKETQVQHAPKETHGPSNGAAERAILEVARQARTLVHALETRYPGYQLKGDSEVFPWVIRHSGWLITRFLIKADGRTPYERLKGREYKGEIVDPLETVHYKIDKDTRGKLDAQTSIGIWLGKTLSADEHVIGTPQGIRKWEKHRLEAVTGTPWQPKGQALVVPGDNKPLTLPDGRKVRSAYITLERQIKHGPTPGCPGCNCLAGEVKPHNAECKKRFNELYPREAAASREEPGEEGAQAVEGDDMDLTEAEPSGAGGTAQGSAAQGSGGTDPAQSRKDLKKQLADKARERREAAQQQPQEEPKRFRQTQKGAKRTAEVSLEEAAAEAAQEEVIGGLPTLHEESLLAAYPEDGLLDSQGAFDERTGEALPVEKVKKARGRELDKMIEHGVKEDITWEEAKRRGLKIVKSRWVDGWKPLPDDPQGVRSRCVAQEVNVSQRDDVASGTPPLKAHRMVISHAATKAPGARENKKLVARYDVSVAFFHADATGKIAVVPPKDLDQSFL
ncbi:GIP, partial [Symbiodinium necroappetens]